MQGSWGIKKIWQGIVVFGMQWQTKNSWQLFKYIHQPWYLEHKNYLAEPWLWKPNFKLCRSEHQKWPTSKMKLQKQPSWPKRFCKSASLLAAQQ